MGCCVPVSWYIQCLQAPLCMCSSSSIQWTLSLTGDLAVLPATSVWLLQIELNVFTANPIHGFRVSKELAVCLNQPKPAFPLCTLPLYPCRCLLAASIPVLLYMSVMHPPQCSLCALCCGTRLPRPVQSTCEGGQVGGGTMGRWQHRQDAHKRPLPL